MVNLGELAVLGAGSVILLGSGFVSNRLAKADDDKDATKDMPPKQREKLPDGVDHLDGPDDRTTTDQTTEAPTINVNINNDRTIPQNSKRPVKNSRRDTTPTVVIEPEKEMRQTIITQDENSRIRTRDLPSDAVILNPRSAGTNSQGQGFTYNRKARVNYEGLRTDTFNRPIETASAAQDRRRQNNVKPVQRRGESDSTFARRQESAALLQKDLAELDKRNARHGSTNDGLRIATTNTGGSRVETGSKDRKRERNRAEAERIQRLYPSVRSNF